MLKQMRQVYPPIRGSCPYVWVNLLDASSVTRFEKKHLAQRNCTQEQFDALWKWFDYLRFNRCRPQNIQCPSSVKSQDWKSDHFILNLRRELLGYEKRGYFVLILLILQDGVACISTRKNVNYFYDLSAIETIQLVV
jgi:hypothetical protein